MPCLPLQFFLTKLALLCVVPQEWEKGTQMPSRVERLSRIEQQKYLGSSEHLVLELGGF